MQPRLIAALSISALLVGGAAWQRIERQQAAVPMLVAESSTTSPADTTDQANTDITDIHLPDATTSTEKLTDTNLIARQLFGDYLNLSSNGQATDANLNDLASRYADNIATLDKSPKVTSADLTVVADNKANFQNYADTLTLIYAKYRALQSQSLAGTAVTDTSSNAFAKVTIALSSLYGRQARELKAMKVPASLASDHLALVNIYLGDAWGTSVMAEKNPDPATSFASANIVNQNLTNEGDVIADIEKILTQNGI